MNTNRIWRKNKTNIIMGGVVLVALALSHKDISRNMQSIAQSKEAIAINNQKQSALEVQFQFEQEQAKIAEARYSKGCLPVVTNDARRKYVSIQEGSVIRDRLTEKPLPTNTVVCDAQGNTAVIQEDGTVGAIAFTGDRDFVAKRLKRFRAGTYSQPVMNNRGIRGMTLDEMGAENERNDVRRN